MKYYIVTIVGLVLTSPLTDAAKECPLSDRIVGQGCGSEFQRKSYSQLKEETCSTGSAMAHCDCAELRRRTGLYSAQDRYESAIETDRVEPAYEQVYADYLRNFRGAQHPLFPSAEHHYYRALDKLDAIPSCAAAGYDNNVRNAVQRGLTRLYESDGLPIALRKPKHSNHRRPWAFFSSINRYGESTSEFEEIDDVRDFTSEALFSQSPMRLNRLLTMEELSGIVRKKPQFESINRLRLRYESLPALDVFHTYRRIDDAQITDFFQPNSFNEVSLAEYGVALETPLNLLFADLFIRGIYKRIEREGVVEFLPETNEDIDHVEAHLGVSRFIGPDKLNLRLVYVSQDIVPDITNPPRRDRKIYSATLSYQIFRWTIGAKGPFDLSFDNRGLEIHFGAVRDEETFDTVEVIKENFFIGTALNGMGPKNHPLDLRLQATRFTSMVDGDATQDNEQTRYDASLLLRLLDEERGFDLTGSRIAFLHLSISYRRDIAEKGLDAFENHRLGIRLDAKLISRRLRNSSFLLSAEYFQQQFENLDLEVKQFGASISMGF